MFRYTKIELNREGEGGEGRERGVGWREERGGGVGWRGGERRVSNKIHVHVIAKIIDIYT